MSDSDEDDQSDPILRLLGPVLVGRARSGEIGVFASIEVQNQILDGVAKAKNPRDVAALKQIFDETKIARARAHKLDRLISERVQAQDGGGAAPKKVMSEEAAERPVVQAGAAASRPAVAVSAKEPCRPAVAPSAKEQQQQQHDEDVDVKEDEENYIGALPPAKATSSATNINGKRKTREGDEEVTRVVPSLPYQMTARLREIHAVVRVRAEPFVDAAQIGTVTDDLVLQVNGMISDWLRIEWHSPDNAAVAESVQGWVVRASPDGQPLFEPVVVAHDPPATASAMVSIPAEDFYRLVARVDQLESELSDLRRLLRSA